MSDYNDIAQGFMREDTRCQECGLMPPDHDPVCPNNPAINSTDPYAIYCDLKCQLEQLEASSNPDFMAIADVAHRMESISSHIRQHKKA